MKIIQTLKQRTPEITQQENKNETQIQKTQTEKKAYWHVLDSTNLNFQQQEKDSPLANSRVF